MSRARGILALAVALLMFGATSASATRTAGTAPRTAATGTSTAVPGVDIVGIGGCLTFPADGRSRAHQGA